MNSSDNSPDHLTAANADSTATTLRTRHVTMIALGGIIGAGLFVTSSSLISTVGPAVLITYSICGLIVFLVMRMLAELALSARTKMVFSEYTRAPLGNWAAFLSGWLYCYFWLIVVAVETLAGAATLQRWVPLPIPVLGAIILGTLTLVNMSPVRTFGELEFWFASVKVLAIVLFVAFGLYYLWDPARTAQAGSVLLYHDGGFAPYGVQAILRKVPAALFATCGAEIAAVAAMDSANPAANIARTTQTVIVRVVTFYVGSLLIVLMVVPWRSVVSGFSPFVTALDATGVHHAGDVMNIVIFTAILSCLNSGIYVASRVMRGLAEQGDAPAWIGKPDKNGTPQAAVLAVVAAGGALTLASLHSFRGIFDMLLAASGAIMLFIYLLIAAAQIANRRILSREGRLVPRVHLWLYPWSSWLVMAMIVGVLLLMALDRDTRLQEAASVVAALAVLTVYGVARLVRRRHADTLRAASVPD